MIQNNIKSTFVIIILILLGSFACKEKKITEVSHETRGVWITRWDYTTRTNSTDPDIQKAEIKRLFKIAKDSNLNTIFFQIRGNFDAYYRSSYEPWSHTLSGSLGVDPGWDPLEFAIDESKELGLQLHAWVNTFSLWKGIIPPDLSEPLHVYHTNPGWIVADSNGTPMSLGDHYIYANPGDPEVRDHILNIVRDIAENYDIDGMHFDYIRYPEWANHHGYSQDSISIKEYLSYSIAADSLSWEDWQRENVHAMVKGIKEVLTTIDPNIAISAAVLGKYKLPGWSGYDVVYQDAVPWIENGWLDFIVPMAYTKRSHETSSFTSLIHNWKGRVKDPKSVLAGIAVYRAEGKNSWGWKEIAYQIIDVRNEKLGGMVFFNGAALKADWWTIQNKFFKDPILPQPVRRPDSLIVNSQFQQYFLLSKSSFFNTD